MSNYGWEFKENVENMSEKNVVNATIKESCEI